MQRRTFLALVLSVATSLTLWRAARGENNMAFKGCGCNNLNATLINPLNAGWFHTSYNPDYCLTPLPNLNPATRWCMHLFDVIPNPADIAAMTANNPHYDHWFFVGGNEPDLSGISPKQTKQLTTAQIDMVLQGDPQAKFCLTMGSQLNAFGGQSVVPYVCKVWEKLDAFYRSKILAFHTHYYPQVALGENNPNIYDPALVVDFCDVQNAGLLGLDGWNKNQKVWLTEIGLVKSPLTESDPRTLTWLSSVHQTLGDKCGRYALYGFEGIPGYHCAYKGGLTAYGASFAGI